MKTAFLGFTALALTVLLQANAFAAPGDPVLKSNEVTIDGVVGDKIKNGKEGDGANLDVTGVGSASFTGGAGKGRQNVLGIMQLGAGTIDVNKLTIKGEVKGKIKNKYGDQNLLGIMQTAQ